MIGIGPSSRAADPGKTRPTSKNKIELPGPSDAPAVSVPRPQPRKPADFKSTHFLVHTDLPSKEAHELLSRLETMLGLISKYWGFPPVGIIECYVVKDLHVWPAGSLHPAGQAKIAEEAGVTLSESLTQGNKTVATKAVVYAFADRGTPQHEAVHAYCAQTFGKTGPLWYSEGMAEMGQYWYRNDAGVHCHPFVVQYIRSNRPKPLSAILSEQSITGDSWQNYAWRWALCHLMENNTNYKPRFRPLGLGYLTGQRVSFAETFGPMAAEIAFEYRFFLKHLDEGYRVDLCSWDWKHKFKEPAGGVAICSRTVANRGWQASGALVSPDKKYDYSASGRWQLAKTAEPAAADGDAQGAGRLEGVIFNDFQLSEPFALGAYGSFAPPAEGQLFLRCRDKWNELADNKGLMSVKIKVSGDGQPLSRPSHTAEEPTETAAAQ